MRLLPRFVVALTVACAASFVMRAQTTPQETSTAIKGGGIMAPGWMGKVEPGTREDAGLTVNDAKFSMEGKVIKVHTGPAVTYWNPANKATGNYTVKGTFDEPEYMGINTHPHPYGIVIAGNDMGTDQGSYLYCSAYGNGTFIVRGFGPSVFQVNGPRATANDAIHKAEAKGKPVQQEIAMSVAGDKVTCSVNGTVVGSYDKASLVGPGKLKSTDGVYGIRFAHNTEGSVTGFSMTKDK